MVASQNEYQSETVTVSIHPTLKQRMTIKGNKVPVPALLFTMGGETISANTFSAKVRDGNDIILSEDVIRNPWFQHQFLGQMQKVHVKKGHDFGLDRETLSTLRVMDSDWKRTVETQQRAKEDKTAQPKEAETKKKTRARIDRKGVKTSRNHGVVSHVNKDAGVASAYIPSSKFDAKENDAWVQKMLRQKREKALKAGNPDERVQVYSTEKNDQVFEAASYLARQEAKDPIESDIADIFAEHENQTGYDNNVEGFTGRVESKGVKRSVHTDPHAVNKKAAAIAGEVDWKLSNGQGLGWR